MPIRDVQQDRVKGAMWKHEQKNGERYTLAISRSYNQDGEWYNVHFFDTDRELTNLRNYNYCQ